MVPDGSDPNVDSADDCEEEIYQRCADDEELDANGVCRALDDCSAECDGGAGSIIEGIGTCQCEDIVSVDDICDATC